MVFPATSVPTVSVVPMPRRFMSVCALAKTAALASSIDSRQRAAAGDGGAQRLHRGRARDLAGAVTADAVGHGDEPHRVVDEVGVLVPVANPADVGGGPRHESHDAGFT